MQTCAAIGQRWLGMSVRKAASLGVYCEDDCDELRRRQAKINAALGCNSDDLTDVRWMPRFGEENLLMKFANGVGELTRFHGQVVEAAMDHAVRLVIVDTAADVFGGNENDRSQVRQFISRALGSLAIKINGAVVLCAHPSRAGLSSGEGDGGSTGWSNTLRSRMFLSAPPAEEGGSADADARILERRKANYAARHDMIRLRWKDGVIVRDYGSAPQGSDGRPATDVFLSLLDERNAADRPVSDNSKASNHAPKAFAELPAERRDGYTMRQLKAAMEVLFREGAIAVEAYGRKSDMRKKIVRLTRVEAAA
jgi:RecA-family ATPase